MAVNGRKFVLNMTRLVIKLLNCTTGLKNFAQRVRHWLPWSCLFLYIDLLDLSLETCINLKFIIGAVSAVAVFTIVAVFFASCILIVFILVFSFPGKCEDYMIISPITFPQIPSPFPSPSTPFHHLHCLTCAHITFHLLPFHSITCNQLCPTIGPTSLH